MKTYEEMTGEVLEKVKREKKRRRGIAARIASLSLALVIGLGTITAYKLVGGDPVKAPTVDPAVTESAGLSVGRDYGDIFSHIKENGRDYNVSKYGVTMDGAVSNDLSTGVKEAPTETENSRGEVIEKPSGHSETNVQVAGIDEADLVKTDGEYVYAVGHGAVTVISAKDGVMEKASSFDYVDENGYVVGSGEVLRTYGTPEIYLDGDRLVIVIRAYERAKGEDQPNDIQIDGDIYVGIPYRYFNHDSYFTAIYDIADKAEPRLVGTASISGSGISSRLKDGKLYISASDWYYNSDADIPETFIPSICANGDSALVEPGCIVYGEGENDCKYLNLAEIDVQSAAVTSNLSLLGYTGDLMYQSEENIYVSRTEYDSSSVETQEDGFNVTTFSDSSCTEILKISTAGGLSLVGSAKVDGHLLNSLSMDEYDGYLRVVCSVRNYESVDKWREVGENDKEVYEKYPLYDWDNFEGDEWPNYYYEPVYDDNGNETGTMRLYIESEGSGNEMYNQLYVLDSAMKVTGKLEKLAPDERIYSCRFEGANGYFVTYRETDPLFHVDLSDPAAPRIVDELKLPGHSDYLQRFGSLMLGFGQTDDGEIKLSMFSEDESGAMTELSTFVIPHAMYSDALYERHAILADADRGIICFGTESWDNDVFRTDYFIISWNGQSFTLAKRVDLGEGAEAMRGLFIDGCFYVYHLGYGEQNVRSFDLSTFEDVDVQELASSAGWEKEGGIFWDVVYK